MTEALKPGELERIIWTAMVWSAQQPAPPNGAAPPSYTDSGNSNAEEQCRQTAARIRAALPAPVRVKGLVWGDTFFVVHSSGSFEFFMSDEAAHERAYQLDRGFYCYDAEAVAKFGDRLRTEKEAWEAEEKADYTARILAALEPAPDAMADPRVRAQSELAKALLATDIRGTLSNGAVGLWVLAHLASDQGNSHEENLDAVENALREWLSNIALEAAKGAGE